MIYEADDLASALTYETQVSESMYGIHSYSWC